MGQLPHIASLLPLASSDACCSMAQRYIHIRRPWQSLDHRARGHRHGKRLAHGSACVHACATSVSDQERLATFIRWAIGNGVNGLATADSMLGIYNDEESPERGIAALQDIPEGETVLRIPLRLALTDHADDAEAATIGLEAAPWAVRLAGKLLRERSKGNTSAWQPYIRILPAGVPQLTEADAQLSEYSPLVLAMRTLRDVAADWSDRVPAEATGGASPAEFHWALSVVHSRTFGTAAKEGGVGVRLLLPVVDMFNHGGDERGFTRLPYVPTDSVRWALVPPHQNISQEWEMHVSASRDISAGEEVLLSYGERHNDDFLLHYGFVPPGNPHDDVLLFPSTAAALEWYFDRAAPQQHVTELEARQLYDAAMTASQQAAGSTQAQGPDLRLNMDCRVDPRLLAAFEALAPHRASVTIALRCEELLAGCTPLLHDLAVLVSVSDGEDRPYFQLLYREYSKRIELMLGRGDFSAVGSAAADTNSSSDRMWATQIAAIAGVCQDATLAVAADAVMQSVQAASSSSMATTLLKYRVNKKVLLWSVLLQASEAGSVS